MFEEEDWVTKFLIAVGMVLLSFLILPAFILQGYVIEIIRRVGRNQVPVLPVWENWSEYLKEGFMATLALIVYSLPAILPACCIVFFATAMTDQQTGELEGAATLLICCVALLIILFSLAVYLIYYAGLIRYAETRQFGSFFEFGRLWRFIRENGTNYGYAVLIIILSSLIGGFIPIIGAAWAYLVGGHVLGQVLRLSGGGAGIPTDPFETPAL
jgi:hypothetical protein